jgi:RNA polymerase sigma factor (sigma-70 family)
MSEPEVGQLSPQVVLSKPGLSWTAKEIEAVCDWLFGKEQYRYMQYWGMRFLGSYAVAEDVEDAIAEFFEQKLPSIIQNFAPSQSSFMNYLVACFRQFCSRVRVKLEKRQMPNISLARNEEQVFENSPELIIDSRFDVHRSLEDKQQAESIQRALKILPPQFSCVVVLHYFQEKSVTEIARELGISETNAKVRLFRARHLLSEFLRRG